MKIFKYPSPESWPGLLARPGIDTCTLTESVASIMSAVRQQGDAALRSFALEFDGTRLEEIAVPADESDEAEVMTPPELKAAIKLAKANIEAFHAASRSPAMAPMETAGGVRCWTRNAPIEKVGLYVPGGSAPLFSTVLMLAIPASLAGCAEVVICSPPNKSGRIAPAILYAARLCGVEKVFKAGGAQAIAAMAFGTETVPAVYKIFGPGNQFVTEAKLQALRSGIAIDMPAGPSEVAVIADETSVPAFVAADLLSQAEHGPDSQVILASTSEAVINAVLEELARQLAVLPRKAIAEKALDNSVAILLDSIDEAIDLMNAYAPEHLVIAAADAPWLAEKISNSGSVFLGNYSCESAGDYASGTNHTLPTNGSARAYSGVSVDGFMKTITFQEVNEAGLLGLASAIETMAEAEGLDAHRRAVSIRREYLGGKQVAV